MTPEYLDLRSELTSLIEKHGLAEVLSQMQQVCIDKSYKAAYQGTKLRWIKASEIIARAKGNLPI